MATKASYSGKDYLKLGILKDFLANPLTTSARNTLAATLGSSHKGLVVYDTDLSTFYVWNGTIFAVNSSVQSGLTPKGNVAYNATEPATPTIGDLYVFTTAGTNTWDGAGGSTGSTIVQISDQVYWDGSAWQFIQGNTVSATETVQGIAEIATQAETNTGTDDVRFITPLKLASHESTKAFGKTYFASGLSLVANTPLTVNHALGLQNRNAFTFNMMVSNSNADVDVDSTDVNNITLTSNVAATVDICVIGF
jgi:uncharacterized membrane protein